MGGDVEAKAGVGIRVTADLLAVQIDSRVQRDAVKLKAYLLALPVRGSRERLSVPADAGGKYPSPDPVGFFWFGGPSMLQSCGTVTVLHEWSLKVGDSAPAGSPRKNFQSASAERIVRRCEVAFAESCK